MARGLLIHNPKAGKQDEELVPKITAALGDVTVRELAGIDPQNIESLAREAGCAWVAAAGGDGTVEAVAAGLTGKKMPLGVIPCGTYNNFARSLDLPLDPLEACAVIRRGDARPVDAGEANGRLFFECLGGGLDASLYPLGEEIKQGRLHRMAAFLRRAYNYRKQRFELTLDRPIAEALDRTAPNESHRLVRHLLRRQGRDIRLSALMLTVSNGPYFGMNFAVAPHQRMDDGLLTVTVFSRHSKLQLWWHFFSIAFGRREYCPKAVAFRVSKIRLDGPRPLPIHLDGNPQEGLWPVDIACRHAALQVFR